MCLGVVQLGRDQPAEAPTECGKGVDGAGASKDRRKDSAANHEVALTLELGYAVINKS